MILFSSPTISDETLEAFGEDQIQVELFGHSAAPVFSAGASSITSQHETKP